MNSENLFFNIGHPTKVSESNLPSYLNRADYGGEQTVFDKYPELELGPSQKTTFIDIAERIMAVFSFKI